MQYILYSSFMVEERYINTEIFTTHDREFAEQYAEDLKEYITYMRTVPKLEMLKVVKDPVLRAMILIKSGTFFVDSIEESFESSFYQDTVRLLAEHKNKD